MRSYDDDLEFKRVRREEMGVPAKTTKSPKARDGFNVTVTRTLGRVEYGGTDKDTAFMAACRMVEDAVDTGYVNPGDTVEFPFGREGTMKIEWSQSQNQ